MFDRHMSALVGEHNVNDQSADSPMSFTGPAAAHEYRALLLYAPNDTAGNALMRSFAKSVACPLDPSKRVPPATSVTHTSFYAMFRQPLPTPECAAQDSCLQSDACISHLSGLSPAWHGMACTPNLHASHEAPFPVGDLPHAGSQIIGYASEEAALARAADQPETVDAVINLQNLGGDWRHAGYTLRLNHTQVPHLSVPGQCHGVGLRCMCLYQVPGIIMNMHAGAINTWEAERPVLPPRSAVPQVLAVCKSAAPFGQVRPERMPCYISQYSHCASW